MRGFVIIILIVGILVIGIVLYGQFSGKDLGVDENGRDRASAGRVGSGAGDSLDNVDETSTVSGGGIGGAGGDAGAGGSSDGNGGGSSECYQEQISYSLASFNKIAVCDTFQGEICVDKTVECSVDVKNLDYEVSGIFKISFVLYNELVGDEEIIEQVIVENFLGSREEQLFENIFIVQSQGEEGNANKELTCSIRTEEVPTKEVC